MNVVVCTRSNVTLSNTRGVAPGWDAIEYPGRCPGLGCYRIPGALPRAGMLSNTRGVAPGWDAIALECYRAVGARCCVSMRAHCESMRAGGPIYLRLGHRPSR